MLEHENRQITLIKASIYNGRGREALGRRLTDLYQEYRAALRKANEMVSNLKSKEEAARREMQLRAAERVSSTQQRRRQEDTEPEARLLENPERAEYEPEDPGEPDLVLLKDDDLESRSDPRRCTSKDRFHFMIEPIRRPE